MARADLAAGPAERRLVAACLLWRGPEALAPLAAGLPGWVGVLLRAARLGVTEAVAHGLLALPDGILAPPVRAQLAAHAAAAAARGALALAELARAQALLAGEGVPSAALKGAALLAAHLPSPGARAMSDLDLLVRPRDLPRAAAALADAGLAPPTAALPPLSGVPGPLARNPGMDHVRAVETWGGVLLELHDAVPGGGMDAEDVVGAAQRVAWQGRPLDLAAPDDLAAMLCRHVVLKHGDDPRLRARHAADLAALERCAALDWSRVAARCDDRAGRFALRRSRTLLEAVRRQADGAPGADDPLAGRAGPLAQLLQGGHTLGRLVRARDPLRAAFPARAYMEARFGLRRGSPWTPLLYPWRLVTGLARRLVGR